MPSQSSSFPPPTSFGLRELSIAIPGEPTTAICLILFFSTTISTGPIGGAPVPLIKITPRMISCGHGPSPSFFSGAFLIWAKTRTGKMSAMERNDFRMKQLFDPKGKDILGIERETERERGRQQTKNR